ncbi:MAG: molybdenum cofactor biosynthesis protein MoaE [Verrucomicrobiota bacterium]
MQAHIYFFHREILIPELSVNKESGAVVEFRGIVRGTEDGQTIQALDYEAHESMAVKELLKITAELETQFSCDQLMFIHRLGQVQVGEMSLYLRVESKHRAEAFGCCQKLIDRMKQDVPIWKSVPS